MSQHTPGPWRVETWRYPQGHGDIVTIQTDQDAISTVCDLWRDGEHSTDERNANGRLITAAPEMCALLQSAVSCWGFMATDMSHGADERNAAKVARDEARALLATIDGGTEE